MIKNFLITGDTHGKVTERLNKINIQKYQPQETALIILGDAGINFFLNDTDMLEKERISKTNFTIYCVRGNHEERPENIKTMEIHYDSDINGEVYLEPNYPNIKYFIDGTIYCIKNYTVLTIGGAYSVDKHFRLSRATTSWTGWFKDEQLTNVEKDNIFTNCKDKTFDFVLTHTCPYSWQPTDLFLSSINQSRVDNSMELWLEDLKNNINWNIWLFGHYHCDRIERSKVEMFFEDIENIETIWDRWNAIYEENT